MFGTLGGQEVVLILIIALIVFGPKKLPDIGKSMGRMMAEFRKASNDFKRTLEEEVEIDKARQVETPPAAEVTPLPWDDPSLGAAPAATPAESSSAADISGSDAPVSRLDPNDPRPIEPR